MKIIIPEPRPYYSLLEEKHYFHWLEEIDGVVEITGTNDGIIVGLDRPADRRLLMEVIALLARFELDMSGLASLCREVDKDYFEDKSAYWYIPIFDPPVKDETENEFDYIFKRCKAHADAAES
jgi:hypothetical protein